MALASGLLCPPHPTFGQAAGTVATTQDEAAAGEFLPFAADDPFDWIQLSSHEWLKGKILQVRDGKLEFDSDELGNLTLDWDDILFVHSPRRQTIQVEDGEDLIGTLLVRDGLVTVTGAQGGTTDTAVLMSVVPGDGSWRDSWSGKLSLGVSTRSGNNSQTDINTYAFFRRQTSATRWDTTFNGVFSEVNGTETTNNSRLTSKFDFFLTRRLFVTPLAVNAFKDPFSNIGLRLIPSAAIGYDLFESNMVSWEVLMGPAYQYTRFDSVLPGEDLVDRTIAVLGGTNVEWDITSDVELKFGYEITAPIPDTQEYTHHMSTVISIDFIEWIDTDLTFIWDRVNQPATDVDGNTPTPNDFRISFGIGIDF